LHCLWNGWRRRATDHLLVRGLHYCEELLVAGVDPWRVTCMMQTHLFVEQGRQQDLE
jgi:hypothetical protein